MAYLTTSLYAVEPGDSRVEPNPDNNHVTVEIGDLRIILTDPAAAEDLALTFADAADCLYAKAGVTDTAANVARTLAIATGGAA